MASLICSNVLGIGWMERWMDGRITLIQLYTYNNRYMILLDSS
jgi:hypothetical protein